MIMLITSFCLFVLFMSLQDASLWYGKPRPPKSDFMTWWKLNPNMPNDWWHWMKQFKLLMGFINVFALGWIMNGDTHFKWVALTVEIGLLLIYWLIYQKILRSWK